MDCVHQKPEEEEYLIIAEHDCQVWLWIESVKEILDPNADIC